MPPKDPDACIKLLDDKGLRDKMGEAGKKIMSEVVDGFPRFSVEFMVKKLDDVYHQYS